MTTTTKTQIKVINSFVSYFGYTPSKINIVDNIAFADNFYCVLNSKGVKKNSWRLDIEN